MRGLGIGMVVTALLMGVATKDKLPLTDAEIKAKAYELGMVESDSLRLTNLQGGTPKPSGTRPPKETEAPRATAAPQETEAPGETAAPGATEAPEQTTGPGETVPPEGSAEPSSAPKETEAPGETAGPEPAVTAQPGEAVAIVIDRGADSYSVSVQLAAAGLIEDVEKYDDYLCNNGYARRICTGTFLIMPGSSEEQIAKIITRTG